MPARCQARQRMLLRQREMVLVESMVCGITEVWSQVISDSDRIPLEEINSHSCLLLYTVS